MAEVKKQAAEDGGNSNEEGETRMKIVFPAGGKKIEAMETTGVQKTAQEIVGGDLDMQFDAIKDLPCVKDEAMELEKAETAVAKEISDLAEKAKEVVDQIADVAKEAVQVAETEGKVEGKPEAAIEIGDEKKPEDEIIIEIEDEKPKDEIEISVKDDGTVDIPGVKDADGVEKESSGCGKADKGKKEPKEKTEEKAEKVEEKTEKDASADSKFVRISMLSPENKKDLEKFWKLIFPTEYVDAMLKNYETK